MREIISNFLILYFFGSSSIERCPFSFWFLSREDSPMTEVEPYIPFNINPAGMQPILTTTYLLAFPSILARLLYEIYLLLRYID